jgi:hypothetical protein
MSVLAYTDLSNSVLSTLSMTQMCLGKAGIHLSVAVRHSAESHDNLVVDYLAGHAGAEVIGSVYSLQMADW